jgi:hypothetical protein
MRKPKSPELRWYMEVYPVKGGEVEVACERDLRHPPYLYSIETTTH